MPRFMVALLAALLALAAVTGIALATASSGITSSTIAAGNLEPVDLNVKTDDWKIHLKTKGESDVTVVENRVAPGGTFGWHSHPGPSLIIVKAGTLTFYHGDDPTCTPHVYQAGDALVDTGNDVHVGRNEGHRSRRDRHALSSRPCTNSNRPTGVTELRFLTAATTWTPSGPAWPPRSSVVQGVADLLGELERERSLVAGYTSGMKTAVSVPDDVFRRADRLARSTGKSRSEIYSAALREYLARHSPDEVTDALDRVMAEVGEELVPDKFVANVARRRLDSTEW